MSAAHSCSPHSSQPAAGRPTLQNAITFQAQRAAFRVLCSKRQQQEEAAAGASSSSSCATEGVALPLATTLAAADAAAAPHGMGCALAGPAQADALASQPVAVDMCDDCSASERQASHGEASTSGAPLAHTPYSTIALAGAFAGACGRAGAARWTSQREPSQTLGPHVPRPVAHPHG